MQHAANITAPIRRYWQAEYAKLRRELELTLDDMAALLNVSRSTYIRIEASGRSDNLMLTAQESLFVEYLKAYSENSGFVVRELMGRMQ